MPRYATKPLREVRSHHPGGAGEVVADVASGLSVVVEVGLGEAFLCGDVKLVEGVGQLTEEWGGFDQLRSPRRSVSMRGLRRLYGFRFSLGPPVHLSLSFADCYACQVVGAHCSWKSGVWGGAYPKNGFHPPIAQRLRRYTFASEVRTKNLRCLAKPKLVIVTARLCVFIVIYYSWFAHFLRGLANLR